MRFEVHVATMGRSDLSLCREMNIETDVLIANQCGRWDHDRIETPFRVEMISTDTIGVGINRNLALSLSKADIVLFSDDDVVYYDSDIHGVIEAFEKHPDADIIFFGLDYTRDAEIFERRRCKDKRVRLNNALKYGAARMAVRRDSLVRHQIYFSTLFGGGAIYGSGEDSLFIRDCFKAGMTAYSDPYVLGRCAKDSSSWFAGFNDKFLFDKGAWLAAAFPKGKHFIKWYFIYKFSKKAEKSLLQTAKLVNRGIKAYRTFETYPEEK